MIKIGSQMAGRSVVCPQCGTSITVPDRSDPSAEAMYTAQRAKRLSEKKGREEQPRRKGLSGIFFKTKAPRDTAEVDRWLEDFWETPEEVDDSGIIEGSKDESGIFIPAPPPAPASKASHRPVPFPAEPMKADRSNDSQEPQESLVESVVALIPAAWRQPLGWLGIGLIVGFVFGIAVHSEFQKRYQKPSVAVAAQQENKQDQSDDTQQHFEVSGLLRFVSLDGKMQPDVGASVLILPDNRPPAVPFSDDGLSPGADIQAQREAALLIDESGGAFTQTDANGRFMVMLTKPGNYLLLFISTHELRLPDESLEAKELANLRRFFKEPERLIGRHLYFYDLRPLDETVNVNSPPFLEPKKSVR